MRLGDIIGQPGAQRLLQRLVASGRLPHGILIEGLPGCGRRSLAHALAQALLCQAPEAGDACGRCDSCRLCVQGDHPDLVALPNDRDFEHHLTQRYFDAEKRQRAGIASYLPVEMLREQVGEQAFQSPLMGSRRVFIIPAAERLQAMRGDAAQVLLKILEEPPPGTFLILTAASSSGLLPTIRSRVARYVLAPLGAEAVEAVLVRQGRSLAEARVLAAAAGGSHRELGGEAVPPPLQQLLRLLNDGYATQGIVELVAALPEEAGEGEGRSAAAEQRRVCERWLAALAGELRSRLRGPEAVASAQAIERVLAARRDLRLNLAPRLVLEGLALASRSTG